MPWKNGAPPLYPAWQDMKRRCYSPKFRQFADYGGRGIRVCDRWLNSYKTFEADMSPKEPGTTLDRIDNELGYSPENCKWSSRKEQQRNRRNTRIINIDGVDHIVAALSETHGIKADVIISRHGRGLSFADITTKGRFAFIPTQGQIDALEEVSKKTRNFATHCRRGHEYNALNTMLPKDGARRCRVCKQAAQARNRKKNGREPDH